MSWTHSHAARAREEGWTITVQGKLIAVFGSKFVIESVKEPYALDVADNSAREFVTDSAKGGDEFHIHALVEAARIRLSK